MQRIPILISFVFSVATLPIAVPSAQARNVMQYSIPQTPHGPSGPGGGEMTIPTATYTPPSYHSVCFIDNYGRGCFLTESSPIPSGAPCHCGEANGTTR
jgi:hypothetical protein